MPDQTVIILGAGIAGLATAAALTRAGIPVTVLEARPRIGGRIYTSRESGAPLPIELGAEFVHGAAPFTRKLAATARLPLLDVTGAHWASHGGKLAPRAHFGDRVGRILDIASRHVRRGRDQSFTEASRDLDPQSRSVGRSFVEGFDAAPAGDISMRSLAGGAEGAETSSRMPAGYDHLAARLAASLPPGALRLATLATAVHWKKGDVRVTARPAAGGSLIRFHAQRLVVTLPLGVLQSNDVPFDPPLPSKARPLAALAAGHVMRMVLQFRDPPWRDAPAIPASARPSATKLAFLHAPQARIVTWWTPYPFDTPQITAWAGGPRASALLELGEPKILEVGLQSLADLLGTPRPKVEARLESWHFHDWTADPLARGAYSYPRVGGASAGRALARPIANTLFFAGEATAPPPENGTVEGAFASGERAAKTLLKALHKKT